jgi:hypothetical protein
MGAPTKRPPRETLSDEPPFTPESLRELLVAQKVVRGGHIMPDDDGIAELARILNGWHGYYVAQQKLRPLAELRKKALDALSLLADVFSQLDDITKGFETYEVNHTASQTILAILRTRLTEIKTAQEFIEAAETFSVLVDPSLGEDRGWRWLAKVLPDDFRTAMLSNNPTFDGVKPVARFIAAVVPSLTGEQPTTASVVTQLRVVKKSLG